MAIQQRAGLFIGVLLALILCAAAPLFGQRKGTKFPVGSRVEVLEGNVWVAGTVVEGRHRGGDWVTVRLDKDPVGVFPPSMPAEVREQALTQPHPPEDVRMLRGRNRRANSQDSRVPIRTWTDRSGKFKISARYERVNDGKAVLRKLDGKRVEVPLDRLSDADAEYVRNLGDAAANPFQVVEEDASPLADDEATDETASAATTKANWKNAKTIRPQTFTKWSFVPPTSDQPGPANAPFNDAGIALAEIPDSQKFFENVGGVYVAQDGKRALVAREQGGPGRNQAQFVEDLDLQSGESRGLIPLPPETAVLDCFADQGLVMYRPEVFGSGEKTLLTIARIENGQLSTMTSFEPYVHEDFEPRRDVDQARFLGPNRILTSNHMGMAWTLWDVDAAKALANIPVGHTMGDRTTLSPDDSLLAVIMEKGIALIDLATVRHVATIPTSGEHLHKVRISDDNRHLAALSEGGLTLWDLSTGKETISFYHPALGFSNDLAWAGDYVLVNNQFLFDAERRILLWEYQSAPGGETVAVPRRGRFWGVSRPDRGGTMSFVSTAMPHAGALELAAELPSAEELLVVRPGDKISIELDIDPNIGSAEKIRESLTKSLEAAQLEVVDSSKLVLKAICKPQPTQTIKINTDNRFPVRDTDIVERTVTPHASYLELSLDGEPLWKRGYIAQPGHVIFMQQGENLDQALERLTKPNLGLIEHAKFSPYVARPGKATENGAYGASQITSEGMVDNGATGRDGAFQ